MAEDIKQMLQRHYGRPGVDKNPRLDPAGAPVAFPPDPPPLPPRHTVENRGRPDKPRVLREPEEETAKAIAGTALLPSQVLKSGLEGAASAQRGDLGGVGLSAAELAALLVPGPGGRYQTRSPVRTLEQLVDYYQQPRGGQKPMFPYEAYLDQNRAIVPVGGVKPGDPSAEPNFKRPPSDVAQSFDSPAKRDHLLQLRDEGAVMGPNGTPVEPWYYNGPVFEALARELGPEEAGRFLSTFADFNAGTSMMTNVARNQWESIGLQGRDIRKEGVGDLGAGDLTGGAFKNKKQFAKNIMEKPGEDPFGEGAHKIRSYGKGLKGNGPGEVFYDFEGTAVPGTVMDVGADVPRVVTPVVLDGIMARELEHKTKTGEPLKRLAGPMYGHAERTIHSVGAEAEMPGMDTQSAIWKAAQLRAHDGDPTYYDSWARTLEDNIIRIAQLRGEDPRKVWADFAHGRLPDLPNIHKFPPLERAAGGEAERPPAPPSRHARDAAEGKANFKLNDKYFKPGMTDQEWEDTMASMHLMHYERGGGDSGGRLRDLPFSEEQILGQHYYNKKPGSLD